ncbi:hypothetical protein ACVPOQ_11895 [Staphylococcus aureus]
MVDLVSTRITYFLQLPNCLLKYAKISESQIERLNSRAC